MAATTKKPSKAQRASKSSPRAQRLRRPERRAEERKQRVKDRYLEQLDYADHRMALLEASPLFCSEREALQKALQRRLAKFMKTHCRPGAAGRVSAVQFDEEPEITRFEARWRVRVNASLGNTHADLLILDDYYPLSPAPLEPGWLAWLERAVTRNPGRFLFLDRRVSRDEAREFIEQYLPGGRSERRPIKLDPGQVAEDVRIVRAQPRSRGDFEALAAQFEPRLAREIHYGEDLASVELDDSLAADSRRSLDNWERLVRRLRDREAKLRPLISPR